MRFFFGAGGAIGINNCTTAMRICQRQANLPFGQSIALRRALNKKAATAQDRLL